MPIRAAYFDWNGTLIQDRDDVGVLDAIRYKVQWERFNPLSGGVRYHTKPFWDLWALKNEVDRLYKYLNDGANPEIVYKEIYAAYNKGVVEGLPMGFVESVIDEYAGDAAQRVDKPVLDQIRKARSENPTLKYLVLGPSSGCRPAIEKTLESAGYEGVFTRVIGNRIEQMNGGKHAKRFGIELLGSDVKRRFLEEDLAMMDVSPADAIYMGDSEMDWGCFELLAEAGGVPIVAPMAPKRFSESSASRYGLKVKIPVNAKGFGKILLNSPTL